MKIICNNIIPVPGFAAINLFGVLFVRDNVILTSRIINHERIHTAQMKELLYIGFYLWYGLEWLIKLRKHRSESYYNISFEREAYVNEGDINYLRGRKFWRFIKYLKA